VAIESQINCLNVHGLILLCPILVSCCEPFSKCGEGKDFGFCLLSWSHLLFHTFFALLIDPEYLNPFLGLQCEVSGAGAIAE
jgi:hypothetical protein